MSDEQYKQFYLDVKEILIETIPSKKKDNSILAPFNEEYDTMSLGLNRYNRIVELAQKVGDSKCSRFRNFSQHELSILYEVLKEPNLTFLFLDSGDCMKDQNNPHERTRKALFKELNEE